MRDPARRAQGRARLLREEARRDLARAVRHARRRLERARRRARVPLGARAHLGHVARGEGALHLRDLRLRRERAAERRRDDPRAPLEHRGPVQALGHRRAARGADRAHRDRRVRQHQEHRRLDDHARQVCAPLHHDARGRELDRVLRRPRRRRRRAEPPGPRQARRQDHREPRARARAHGPPQGGDGRRRRLRRVGGDREERARDRHPAAAAVALDRRVHRAREGAAHGADRRARGEPRARVGLRAQRAAPPERVVLERRRDRVLGGRARRVPRPRDDDAEVQHHAHRPDRVLQGVVGRRPHRRRDGPVRRQPQDQRVGRRDGRGARARARARARASARRLVLPSRGPSDYHIARVV